MKMEFIIIMFSFLHLCKGVQYSPLIIIPGDGGNQLEAKFHKPPDNSGCSLEEDWHRLWLDVWSLQGSRLRCWAENIKLIYNATARTSRNVDGVFTRVPGFGDTSSVEYLDPSWTAWLLADAGNYMKDFVDFFVSEGFQRGASIRAAPYDFRFAPHSQTVYFTALKQLIEDTSSLHNGAPVSIISHSMGGLFGLYFLQNQDPDWCHKYIHRFIPVNCPWLGATVQLNTYASGYNLGISIIDPAVIREEQRSYETGVYILPHPHSWLDLDQVLVSTPHRNYTVRDYPAFFTDIGFPQGLDMLDNVVNITSLDHPGVRTSSVYSLGVPTPTGLVYEQGFPDSQPLRLMGDGDGTVTRDSLSYIDRFLNKDGDNTLVLSGLDHGAVLKNKKLFNFILSQLVL